MNYLDELNEAQQKAVLHVEGPMMVLAGAGSGKTRVLTYRIAHLVNNYVDPFNILALTFTNKAAREMKERIAKIVGESEAKNLWMGTFHSVFAKILRIESEKIGYPSNFTIYDTDDAKSLIKTIIKEMNLDDKVYKPRLVYGRISSAKNNLVSASRYMNDTVIQSEDRQSGKPLLGEIFMKYEKRCFKAGAMDFDDLLFKTNVLLRDFPDVLHKYQSKFNYVLVDEFQDTNFSQFTILKQLAARHENICVVGDDAQSIYAFRGANIENILNFQKVYPDTKVYKLEQNYRSTQTIVKAANSLIEKNKEQLKKEVWTSNTAGDKIKLFKGVSDVEEGQLISNEIIEAMHNNKANYDEFAILYRTNAQSRAIEEALRKREIPYRIFGGLSFYQRKEIKDLLAYFRLTINPQDEEAFKRIINYPARGIGKTSLEKLTVAADRFDTTLWEVCKNNNMLAEAGISGAAANKIGAFIIMIESFQVKIKKENAYDLGNRIASSSGLIKELYSDKSPEGLNRYENIQELLSALKDFSEKEEEDGELHTLDQFMEEVALLTDQDTQDDDGPKVSLMTVHAAKGLEFPFVFIVGMEENLFPSQLSLNSRADLEEERRLFYVAITRAEKQAFLSYADSRFRWGNMIYCEPSRFLQEIEPSYVLSAIAPPMGGFASTGNAGNSSYSFPKRRLKATQATTTPADFTPDDTSKLQVGETVKHPRFGQGKVVSLEGDFPNTKAEIIFDNFGKKQLLLKFAKLKILSTS